MKLLAFDTSTEMLSIALQPAAGVPALVHTGAGGALASAALLPAIQQLLAQAGLALRQLDAIAFGRGPGSFTGLRTACAVAQGLGFGAELPVLPIDTLLAVAQEAHCLTGTRRVVAVLDARMDEVYVAAYALDDDGAWTVAQAPALCRPEQVQVPPGWTLAGNALLALGPRLPPAVDRVTAWPTASALLLLAPAALAAGPAHAAADALPLYIRDKVAQTVSERAEQAARKLAGGTAAVRSPR